MPATARYASYPRVTARDGSERVEFPPHVQEARVSLSHAREIIAGAMVQLEFPDQHDSAYGRMDTAINALINARHSLREGGAL